ncbi:Hsp20/alpha crystallin family protein [Catellatospora citrea]
MMMRFDPFRDFDRLAGEVFGTARTPAPMPMDCLRTGDTFVVRFDMPGIDTDSLDVSAENGTLTVRGERHRNDPDDASYLVSERPAGSYSRQLVLGDGLDVEAIRADYRDGVLTLTIPVAERAKPRRIEVTRNRDAALDSHGGHKMISSQATERDRTKAGAAT